MRIKTYKSEKGFTIVELLIATTIFSVILLMASAGIIQIGQMYYKGITQARTQETARSVVEDLKRSVQFSKDTKVVVGVEDPAIGGTFCFGDVKYVYTINQKVDTNLGTHALTSQRLNGASCAAGSAEPINELLSERMRLLSFSVLPEAYDNSRNYKIHIRLAYGDNDLLTSYTDDADDAASPLFASTAPECDPANPDKRVCVAYAQCKAAFAGGSFCATAELDTIVKKRLN